MFQQVKAIDDKLEARLHDTRPIWEAVQSQLAAIRTDIHRLDRKFDLLQEDLNNARIKQRDLEERVDELDRKAS